VATDTVSNGRELFVVQEVVRAR